MKILKTKSELHQWQTAQPNKSIGLVPTMGALHEGHLSLVRASKKECQKTIVSIFINKLQFGPNEDFNQYPRSIEQDVALLKNEKVDVLFMPDQTEIYPDILSFQINETIISKKLEGASRPNFFSGVIMVVLKLFNLIQPSIAYFGEKDIQQLYIIKKMIADFDFPISLRSCPTIREKNGLAMSSRNRYLSEPQKTEASVLYKALKKGEILIKEKKSINAIKEQLQNMIIKKNMRVDYIAIVDINTFDEVNNCNMRPIVIAGAIYCQKIRLIDNIIIK